MAQRATSLGPKPSLFFCFCFLFFVFLFCFFGGFKGQVRWPKGPPHLALNPSLFSFCFFFGFCFSSLLSFLCFLIDKKLFFPPKKGHCLFIFQCLPLFLFSLFGASPPFFPFSFFVSLLFFSFFLPSFLFFIFSFWFLLFLFVVFAFFVSRCFFCFCCSA